MKRRGLRVALTVASLGLALIAGLVAFNWATLRDHAEAWWFQLTSRTGVIAPESGFVRAPPVKGEWNTRLLSMGTTQWAYNASACLRLLANDSGQPVILTPAESPISETWRATNIRSVDVTVKTADIIARMILEANGYRILEQRFPCRAYVVTGYPPPLP